MDEIEEPMPTVNLFVNEQQPQPMAMYQKKMSGLMQRKRTFDDFPETAYTIPEMSLNKLLAGETRAEVWPLDNGPGSCVG